MKTEDLKNYIFEQLNETSYALQQKLYNGRRDQAHRAAATAHDIHAKNMKMAGKTGPLDPSLMAVRGLFVNDMDKAFASAKKADNRSKKLLLKRLVQTGDGSPNYTPKQESALNFINSLKRLQEAKKFPPITMEELKSPDATKHHARRGVKHPDPKVAIEALKLGFRLNDAKTAWMGKDHPDQEVRDTAEMSMNMDEN